MSLGTNCRLGRYVAWDELSLGTNCRLGRIVAWDELSLGTNCRLGRIVAYDEMSLGKNCRFLEIGTNCRFLEFGTICCMGRIVARPFVNIYPSPTNEVEGRLQLVVQTLLQVVVAHQLQVLVLAGDVIGAGVGLAAVEDVGDAEPVQQLVVLGVVQGPQVHVVPDAGRLPVEEGHLVVIAADEREPAAADQRHTLGAVPGVLLAEAVEATCNITNSHQRIIFKLKKSFSLHYSQLQRTLSV